jgi:hypothetical protein
LSTLSLRAVVEVEICMAAVVVLVVSVLAQD